MLLITKTKPTTDYSSHSQFLSIALISEQFLKDSSSQFLIAPLVSFEMKNKKIYKELTPKADHFLKLIARYTIHVFSNAEEIKTYALNIMSEQGTHIFVTDLRQVSPRKGEDPVEEFISVESQVLENDQKDNGDIRVNP